MKVVFADTFYFVALLNPRDQHHTRAVEASRTLNDRLVTTHWVLVELADAFSSIPLRTHAAAFVVGLTANPAVEVVADPLVWYRAGLALYGNRSDKEWSLTDCISFAIMESRGIREALTGDHHFAQAGFVAILA
jgi:predicted nucleic acid-binding protein